jgi:uncharacterized protein YhaN
MFIKEIYIDGFGIFYEHRLKALTKGINIIEGENEAGKSTLLDFIRFTLFGYPGRNADKHEPTNSSAAHGGRIITELSNGKEAVFERHAGPKGGKIQLHFNGNVSYEPSTWSTLLGNANIQLYQNICGFTLNELISFENLESSGIEDRIFSLGIGVTNVSIGAIEKRLLEKAENIYKKGGSKQDVPRLLKSIEDKKSQIIAIQNNLHQYESLLSQIANSQTQINELTQKVKEKNNEKELLSNYLKCYDNYINILQIDRDLKEAPSVFVCPEDSKEQLTNLETQAETLNKGIAQLQFNDSNDGIEQIENAIDNIQINLTLLSEEGHISRLAEQLEKYQSTIGENSKTREEIKTLETAVNENIKRINSRWSEDNVKEFANLVAHRDVIQQYNSQFEELKLNKTLLIGKKQAVTERAGVTNKNVGFYLGILIPILLSIPAFFYSIPFGIAFIGVAILVGAFFIVSRKANKAGDSDELKSVEASIEQLTNRYNQYLNTQLNLQENLSTAAVLEIFGLIETTNGLLLKKNDLQTTYRDRAAYIEHFESSVSEIRDKKLFHSDANSHEAFISAAKQELSTAKRNFDSKERLTNVLDSKRREQKRLQVQLEKVQVQIDQLFLSVQTSDRNSFLVKFNEESNARQLLAQRKNLVNAIELTIGFEKTEELFSFLDDKDRLTLESQLEQLQDLIATESSSVIQMANEKGRLETELRNVVSNSTLSELETELEVERGKLFECYKQWMKKRLAFNVLNTIKRRYELEKQPDVVRYSSEIFSAITSGRYKRIHVPLDSREVLVYDQQERAKKIEQLSRGTKEQLLISLRFGLIEEYEKNKEPLPIVLDDVFVNFDSCRTKNVAAAIQKFAENRQVIIFTCHPNLADSFSTPVNKIELLPFRLNGETIPNELLTGHVQQN